MLLSDCPASLPELPGNNRLPAVPAAFRYPPAGPTADPARAALAEMADPDVAVCLFNRPCSKVWRRTLSSRGFSNSSSFCKGCRASRIWLRVERKLRRSRQLSMRVCTLRCIQQIKLRVGQGRSGQDGAVQCRLVIE